MDVGTFLLMLGLSYALGLLWVRPPARQAARAGLASGGVSVPRHLRGGGAAAACLPFDPKFGNLHLITVLIGSLVAVVVDWVIRQARHPSLVLTPEARGAAA